ncbi:uncharacterized protein LOC144075139 [Stigmatopora argus]
MLIEEKRRNNEDLALLESENISVETQKNDLAKTLGSLRYANFMKEMPNQDVNTFDFGQKEDILNEQNQLFNFNLIWDDSRSEKVQKGTGKYGMALLESRCLEMETRNDDAKTQLAHNRTQLEKVIEELEKMPKSLNSIGIQELALGSQKANLFPNKPVLVPACNNNLDEKYKPLKDQITDLNMQLKNHQESEDVLIRQNDFLTSEVAELQSQILKMNSTNGSKRTQGVVFPDNEIHLKDQMKSIKDELTQLQSQNAKLEKQNGELRQEKAKTQFQSGISDMTKETTSKKKDREKEDLRAKVKVLEENKNQQCDEIKSLTDKLALLQPQSVHMEKLNSDLREKVKRLQENKSCHEDDMRTLNDALVRMQSQSAKMETQNCEVKGKVKALHENKNQLQDEVKSLSDQVAVLQSQRKKMEEKNNDLRAHIKALQENEDILIKQNEALGEEVTHLERSNVRTDKENENLRARVKALKENENILSEKTETLTTELSHFESQREKDQTKIYSLRTELQTLRCELQRQDELLWRVNHAESLMEKECAEKERLRIKLDELEEEDNFVKRQNDDARIELEKNKFLQEHQSELIAQLKEALQEHKLQLEDCHFLIYSKDDELEKQNKKIMYQNENTEELESLVTSFKQQMHELQCQLELKQMDEILTANDLGRSLADTELTRDPIRGNLVGLRKEVKDVDMQVRDFYQNDHFLEPNSLMQHTLTLRESPSLMMETENEELRAKLQELQENEERLTELNSYLKEKVAHLKSWGTRNGDLALTVEDLQENEDLLPGQSHPHNDNLSLKLKTENGDLRVQVQDLKDNEKLLKQRTETLMDERDTYKTENNHLKTYSETLTSQLSDQSDLRRRVDLAESQAKKYLTDNEKLRNKLHELEENDTSHKTQHEVVQQEREAQKSVRDQQNEQIAKLNAALKYNELQVEEANQRKRLLDDRLAFLESQSVKMEREEKDLRAQLKDHQNILSTEKRDFLHEELTPPNSPNVTMPTKAENNNQKVTLSEQNELFNHKMSVFESGSVNMETENENLREQVKVLKENKDTFTQQKVVLCEKLAHLESWSVKMETHLGAQVKFLQDNKDMLIKQNESLNNEVAQLERWGVIMKKQNENAQARLNVLKEDQDIMNAMMETITANLTQSETQRDKDKTDMCCMRSKLQTVNCQLQDQDELLKRTDQAESHLEKARAENNLLGNQLRDVQEEKNHLKKQYDKDQVVIYRKDELLAKQKREMEYQNEVILGLNSLIISLKQKINDLGLRQMEQIILAETVHKEEHINENQLNLKTGGERTQAKMKALHCKKDLLIEQKRVFRHTLALCDSPNLKLEAENEELRTQFKELKENLARMTEMNSQLLEKLTHLDSCVKLDANNGDFNVQIGNPKEIENIFKEETKTIVYDVCHVECQMDDIEIPPLRTDTLVELPDQGDLKNHVETGGKKDGIEVLKLNNTSRDNDEKDILLKRNDFVSLELGDHTVGDQQSKTMTPLKTGFKDHPLKIEEPGIVVVYMKDDFFPMKVKETSHEDTYGERSLFISLEQRILNFQHKLRRMEEILNS